MLERHPLGSQSFVRRNGIPGSWWSSERPEPEACRAFFARGGQGLQIGKGVWRHPLMALQPAQDFLVDHRGPGENLQEHDFDETIEIVIDPV